MFASAKISLQQGNNYAARSVLQQVLQDANLDSTTNLTNEAYDLIRYNTEYLLSQFPSQPPGLLVKLTNSSGSSLSGGSLQYYEGTWKDATNNGDGTFTVNTTQNTVSLRMTYAYGSQTKSNVPVNGPPVIFQTTNVSARLQDSRGNALDTGTVQYYAGAWRPFGTTSGGVASKELLPNSYSFRMTYAYGSNDKQQNIGTDPNVIFRSVNATVQLKDSQGNLRDQGSVQYYAGAWRPFGTTSGGSTTKELLPASYSFRMTSDYVSNDKAQDLSANSTVSFSSVLCTISVKNAQGQPVSGATVSYYAGAWRTIGTTVNGTITKELLPANLSFRVSYNGATQDKVQNIGTSATVELTVP